MSPDRKMHACIDAAQKLIYTRTVWNTIYQLVIFLFKPEKKYLYIIWPMLEISGRDIWNNQLQPGALRQT